MNKKITNCFGLVLLLMSLFPFSLSNAETSDEIPTGESTISSLADDPLDTLSERADSQVSTTEETGDEASDQSSESIPSSETNPEETNEEETQPTRQSRSPYSVNLIEGEDIDADFAQALRTTPSTQDLGMSWTGYGKNQDELTVADMETLSWINVANRNLTSIKGIEYATNITRLICSNNKLPSVDLSANIALTELQCVNNKLENLELSANTALVTLESGSNQLSDIDLAANTELKMLGLNRNQLTTLNLAANTKLTKLDCSNNNQLNQLDLTTNVALEILNCNFNPFSDIDLSTNVALTELQCSYTQLTSLDLATNTELSNLQCTNNQLSNLDVSANEKLETLNCASSNVRDLTFGDNTLLTYLDCRANDLTNIDVRKLSALQSLFCFSNQLSELDVTQNPALQMLYCYHNSLAELDVTQNLALTHLHCGVNQLSELDVGANLALTYLNCGNNQLSELDVSANLALTDLSCENNQIADMSSAFNLSSLTALSASDQKLKIPVPEVSSSGEAIVDILTTAPGVSLFAYSDDPRSENVFSYDGDKIIISNVSQETLNDSHFTFQAMSGSKHFGGQIYLYTVSDLESQLEPSEETIQSGDIVEWTWSINCPTSKKAEDIFANLNLPSGLVLDSSSIKRNGNPTTINDINGTNNLGELNQSESIVFTFKTTASGNPSSWLEAKGRLEWKDDTVTSPHSMENKGAVLIQDEEQTYTPKDHQNMAIQSVPVRFNYGISSIMTTARTHHLSTANYQSDTNVVTDGFYTRIKDDRSMSTGWKLTAKLSNFTDNTNQTMPNSTGASLKLENMSIEKVSNRDTPQESIDPSPTGVDKPNYVSTNETLVAGQPTAQTLISAQPNKGIGTWQLRIPFDKISLNLPANAGKSGTSYKANLTWSLDDTI